MRAHAIACNAASDTDKTPALNSSSWGCPQTIGFNHEASGIAPAACVVATSRSSSNRTRGQTGVVTAALIVWSLVMLWLCWRYGIQHDYKHYVSQWQLLLGGANPWWTDNTYGPLHAVIGFLLPWSNLAPKFFMVGALLIANAALVLQLTRGRGMSSIQAIYLIAVPTNVLVVGVGVLYGLNDAFVAALLTVAVLLTHRGHLLAAGLVVGLASLTKYYPLLLLPFFALDERRLSLSAITSGIALFCVGFAASVAIWGQAPIDAILQDSNREPSLLSIIAALESLFGDDGVVRWLIRYNTFFVLLGVAVAFLFAWRARLNWLEGAVLGYLVMLTFYKVGHQQFYVPWLFMVASLPLVNKQSADRMAIIFLPAVLLLSLYHFGYDFASDKYDTVLGWVRSYGGFIAFPVGAASIGACVVDLWWRRRTSLTNRTPFHFSVLQSADVEHHYEHQFRDRRWPWEV
jgi:glycosyl transferase family 87